MTAEPALAHRRSAVGSGDFYALVVLAIALGYIAIFTIDPVPVPLKIPALGAVLAIWLFRPLPTLRRYDLGRGVLAMLIVVPLTWLVLGWIRSRPAYLTTQGVVHFDIEQARRFAYLALFFPVVDAMRRYERVSLRAAAIWLVPIFILCFVTLVVRTANAAGVLELAGTTELFGAFAGVIGETPTGPRVFFGNHVLLLTAIPLLLAVAITRQPRVPAVVLLVVVAETLVVTRTRGLSVGAAVGVGVVGGGLLVHRLTASFALRCAAIAVAVAAAAVGTYLLINLTVTSDDASLALRRQQYPELREAFLDAPLIGHGFGATLPSGYFRNLADPWSFELTYLQLLFQVGGLGLLAILALPAYTLLRVARVFLRPQPSDDMAVLLAAAGAILAVLVASATNPYLFSSFGMLALAIGLALAEVALRRSG